MKMKSDVVKYTVELPKTLVEVAAAAGQEANEKHPRWAQSAPPIIHVGSF